MAKLRSSCAWAMATVCAALCSGLCAPALAQAGSAANGRLLFDTRCVACHSVDAHRVGPALGGVYGRAAGKASGFGYSKALAAATHVWERDALLAWLTNPEALIAGQAMGYQVQGAQDRDDIVAYLASLSGTSSDKPHR